MHAEENINGTTVSNGHSKEKKIKDPTLRDNGDCPERQRKIASAVEQILGAIGEDPQREGLQVELRGCSCC